MLDNPENHIDSSLTKLNNTSNSLVNNSLNPLQHDWKGFGSQKLLTLAGETLIHAWQNQTNPTPALVYAAGSIFKNNFAANVQIAFGEAFNVNKAETLGADILGGNYGVLPDVRFLSNAEMNGALGAYAKSSNTIYINSGFITQNSANPTAVGKVLVEEEGHFLDAYASPIDSPGDEGEILAGLVQGKIFNQAKLIPLKAEDDSSVFTINGQSISVELASPSDFGINLNSNSYTQTGGNVFRYGVFDQCTEFAYGRALEKGLINQNSGVGAKIRGNAGQWDDQAGSWSKQARANSFVVWDANQGGAGKVGHVAFVERVNSNGSFVISEFNWNYGDGKFNSRTIELGSSAFKTAKFINLDSSTLSSISNNSNESRDKISNFYRDILGREPDANGLQSWLDALGRNMTLAQVRSGFGHSYEARGKVIGFYRDILRREPDANGLQSWLDTLGRDMTLAQVRSGFGHSDEARGKVIGFYRDILGREPDANGLQSWLDTLGRDKTLAQVRSGFGHSDEARGKVTGFYRDILRREPDANGLQSWLDTLGRDKTLAQVRSDITNSDEARRLGGAPLGLMATSENRTKLINGELNSKSFDVDGYYGAQCWDLVAYATGNKTSTSNWKRGANVIANGNVAVGTAIATFLGSNGAYDNPIKNANGKTTYIQHTAIFAGYGTENGVRGFYVWDQNWDNKSYVQKHFIRTDRSGTSDADNYHVIQI